MQYHWLNLTKNDVLNTQEKQNKQNQNRTSGRYYTKTGRPIVTENGENSSQ